MVKITGPLGSESASGSFGKTLTISSYKGKAYIRRHVTPKNNRSPPQIAMRAMLSFLAHAWATLTPAQQATWTPLATETNVPPMNAFIAYNQQRWTHLLPPSKLYPAVTFPIPAGPATLTATGQVHSAKILLAIPVFPQPWAFLLHRTLILPLVPAWHNLVAVVPRTGFTTIFIDQPLAAGTYQYRARPFFQDGMTEGYTPIRNATVS